MRVERLWEDEVVMVVRGRCLLPLLVLVLCGFEGWVSRGLAG